MILIFFSFPLPTFNFYRGKDAFSSNSETIFLKTVEFTLFCVSVMSSLFLPQARQANYSMIEASVSTGSSSSSGSGRNYEKWRSIFQHCPECYIRAFPQRLMLRKHACIVKFSGLFLSFIRAASKLLFGNQ